MTAFVMQTTLRSRDIGLTPSTFQNGHTVGGVGAKRTLIYVDQDASVRVVLIMEVSHHRDHSERNNSETDSDSNSDSELIELIECEVVNDIATKN